MSDNYGTYCLWSFVPLPLLDGWDSRVVVVPLLTALFSGTAADHCLWFCWTLVIFSIALFRSPGSFATARLPLSPECPLSRFIAAGCTLRDWLAVSAFVADGSLSLFRTEFAVDSSILNSHPSRLLPPVGCGATTGSLRPGWTFAVASIGFVCPTMRCLKASPYRN